MERPSTRRRLAPIGGAGSSSIDWMSSAPVWSALAPTSTPSSFSLSAAAMKPASAAVASACAALPPEAYCEAANASPAAPAAGVDLQAVPSN